MRYVVTTLLLLLAAPIVAYDTLIYESVDDLTIGTVFLTPEQRRWLDANRGVPPNGAQDTLSQVEEQKDRTSDARPAGYIVNSSGQTRRYRDGEFSQSDAAPAEIRFPDDVEIRRHVPSREAEGAEDEEPNDEAG